VPLPRAGGPGAAGACYGCWGKDTACRSPRRQPRRSTGLGLACYHRMIAAVTAIRPERGRDNEADRVRARGPGGGRVRRRAVPSLAALFCFPKPVAACPVTTRPSSARSGASPSALPQCGVAGVGAHGHRRLAGSRHQACDAQCKSCELRQFQLTRYPKKNLTATATTASLNL
jgi:hypothetical protein